MDIIPFRIINISLGEIKVGVQQNVYFPYNMGVNIMKMLSPCDCATPVNEMDKMRVLVRYQPKGIPTHLLQKQIYEMSIKKVITIVYRTEEEPGEDKNILLSFNATVKQ